jgi:hypothetical protein
MEPRHHQGSVSDPWTRTELGAERWWMKVWAPGGGMTNILTLPTSSTQ